MALSGDPLLFTPIVSSLACLSTAFPPYTILACCTARVLPGLPFAAEESDEQALVSQDQHISARLEAAGSREHNTRASHGLP